MRRMLLVGILVLLMVASAQAEDFKTALDRPGVEMATVRTLMQKGQVLIIDEDAKGDLALVTAGIIINAPPEKVYSVLIDFDKYAEFMPSTEACKIVKEEGNAKDVLYKIAFKFSVLSWTVEYTLHQTFTENKEIRWTLQSSKDNKLKSTFGAWQLYPVAGGKTAAFYSAYSDMKNISWVIQKAFEAEPSMEMAVNASSCVMVLKAVKNRLEIANYAPNLKKKGK